MAERTGENKVKTFVQEDQKGEKKASHTSEDFGEKEALSKEENKSEERAKEKDLPSEFDSFDSNEWRETKEKLQKAKQDILYLRAEFDNYRKNMMKEKLEEKKYGAQPLLSALLNIMDLFDQALKSELKQDNLMSFKKGMDMIFSEFKKTLENFGLNEVPLEKGDPFDPREHEALSRKDSPDTPPDHIVEVYRKTYRLYDRVIRPAQVVVSSESKSNESSSKQDESSQIATFPKEE